MVINMHIYTAQFYTPQSHNNNIAASRSAGGLNPKNEEKQEAKPSVLNKIENVFKGVFDKPESKLPSGNLSMHSVLTLSVLSQPLLAEHERIKNEEPNPQNAGEYIPPKIASIPPKIASPGDSIDYLNKPLGEILFILSNTDNSLGRTCTVANRVFNGE
jgi:hypothetical protein